MTAFNALYHDRFGPTAVVRITHAAHGFLEPTIYPIA